MSNTIFTDDLGETLRGYRPGVHETIQYGIERPDGVKFWAKPGATLIGVPKGTTFNYNQIGMEPERQASDAFEKYVEMYRDKLIGMGSVVPPVVTVGDRERIPAPKRIQRKVTIIIHEED